MKVGQSILRAGSLTCDILVPPANKPMGWDVVEALEEEFDVNGFLAGAARQAMKPLPHWDSLIEGLSEAKVREALEGLDPVW